MATNQIHYRARNDDGNETTATWKVAEDTPWIQPLAVNFRIRFKVQNDTAAINNLNVGIQYSLNGGAFTAVNAASSVVRSAASPNLADNANLTEQLSGGTGTFIGATGFDESAGDAGGTSLDLTATGKMEIEYCVQARSADLVGGDKVRLRSMNLDAGAAWTSYSVTAEFIIPLTLPETLSLVEGISKTAAKTLSETLSLFESLAVVGPPLTVTGITVDGHFIFGDVVDDIGRRVANSVARLMDDGTPYRAVVGAANALLSDTVSLTENFQKVVLRAASETAGLTEAIAKQAARAIGEAVGLSEATTLELQKQINETAGLSESLDAHVARLQSASDELALTENLQKTVGLARGDALEMTEVVAKRIAKDFSDALGLSEAIAKGEATTISETVGLSENLTPVLLVTLEVTGVTADGHFVFNDQIDDTGRRVINAAARILEDGTHYFTTVPPEAPDFTQSVSDTLAFTESLSGDLALSDLAETFDLSEQQSRQVQKRLSDTLGLSESLIMRVSKGIAETAGLTEFLDPLKLTGTYQQSLSDNISLVESLARQAGKSEAETASLIEALRLSTARTAAETIGLTENLTTLAIKLQTVSETAALSEALTRKVERAILENTDLTESLVTQAAGQFQQSFTETGQFSEAFHVSLSRSVLDALGLSEGTQTILAKLLGLSDNIALTETLQKSVLFQRMEQVAFTESLVRHVSRAIAETAALTEEDQAAVKRTINETLGLTENFAKTLIQPRSVADNISLVELLLPMSIKAIADTVGFVENLDIVVGKALGETLGVTEDIVAAARQNLSEAVSLAESLTRQQFVGGVPYVAVVMIESISEFDFIERVSDDYVMLEAE